MNISDSVGESSSKRQENGDASSSNERPLKKARFAWQVKGKYHLKNETSDTSLATTTMSNETDRAGPSSEIKDGSNSFVGNAEQNLEILGDYLLKQDFNTLDSVITDPDKSLLTPSTRISTDTLQYPQYVSSFDNNRCSSTFVTKSESESVVIPMSMVVTNSYSEDQCIARWQARQMAKGFVDNMINRVLDSWTHPPLPPDVDKSRLVALDAAEFVNNIPTGYSRRRLNDSIENEGILMAISAHGLQNTSNSTNNDISEDREQNLDTLNNDDKAFLSAPNSPVHSDDEILNIVPNETIDTGESPLSDFFWPCEEMHKDNEMDPLLLFPDSSNIQYFTASSDIHHSSAEFDADNNVTSSHYDFMDAAVSFAIQNKGLTTFGTDYG
ncbi:hypothetical protein evm_002723 [Chilo suppressalis]|nr:hypothetical protein evm_002723 [Chilo suppressalis]